MPVPVPLLATAAGGTGGPYTYAWTPDDGSLSDPNSAATNASPMGFQSYTVTADDGFSQAQDNVIVVNSSPLDLENNCTLYNADYGASSTGLPANISYDMMGTRACELGNNEFGLHLCEQVVFEQTRLHSTVLLDPAASLATGWVEGESYTVTIDYTTTQSDITITRDSDGVVLATFTVNDATFPSGVFGSTTLSQQNACVGPVQGSCL